MARKPRTGLESMGRMNGKRQIWRSQTPVPAVSHNMRHSINDSNKMGQNGQKLFDPSNDGKDQQNSV